MKPEDRYFPMKINKKGEKTMAKLIINEENKKSRIEPEIYGHFSEHLGDVFMREFTSAKNRRFRM